MLLALALLVFALILGMELPGLLKNRLYKEARVFVILFLLGCTWFWLSSINGRCPTPCQIFTVYWMRGLIMRNCFLGMIMLTLLLVNGCGNMIDVEQTAIGAGLGVDLDDQGKIVFFAQFNRPINIQESGISKAQSDIFVGTGKTLPKPPGT